MSTFDHDAHAALDIEIPSWQVPAPKRDRTPKRKPTSNLAIIAYVTSFFLGTVGTSASLIVDGSPFTWLVASLATMIVGALALTSIDTGA